MRTTLVLDALRLALRQRTPGADVASSITTMLAVKAGSTAAGQGARLANPLDLRLADREQHPPRCGNRRDLAEQRGLTLKHSEV